MRHHGHEQVVGRGAAGATEGGDVGVAEQLQDAVSCRKLTCAGGGLAAVSGVAGIQRSSKDRFFLQRPLVRDTLLTCTISQNVIDSSSLTSSRIEDEHLDGHLLFAAQARAVHR